MTSPDRSVQLELVREANRAPSVHNVQPARWRFGADGEVWLFEDAARRLRVADPTGRDGRLSLGAAFEGLTLALSRRGLALETPELAPAPAPSVGDAAGLVPVARAVIRPGTAADPLAGSVSARRTFRGRFVRADADARRRLGALLDSLPGVVPVLEPADVRDVGALNDRASWEFLRQPEYQQELYRWMRLSHRHPGWGRDGLNADALALSGPERFAAALALHPSVFAVLRALGVGRFLVAEAPKTASATAVAILTAARREDRFEAGRRFYRTWLAIAAAGFALCPMSALVDSDAAAAELKGRYRVAPDAALVNVFRIGPAPSGPSTPRLPAEELLV
jgi:hypothetical protein